MSASPARRVARDVVTRVRERSAYAHELMDSALRAAALSPADAALATRLAYGTLQAEGTLAEAVDRYLGGKRIEPRIADALRVSAYEILFLRSEKRAAVHQGVELVREVRKQAAGLANAVLRRLAEDAPSFPWGDPRTDTQALARLHAHPEWLAKMWIDELGRDLAEQVMAADNTPAPLYLAANTFSASAEAARQGLRSDGALPHPGVLPGSIEVGDPGAAVRGQTLQKGWYWPSTRAHNWLSRWSMHVRDQPSSRWARAEVPRRCFSRWRRSKLAALQISMRLTRMNSRDDC